MSEFSFYIWDAALGYGFFICKIQMTICISLHSERMEGLTLHTSAEFSPAKSLDRSLERLEACLSELVMPAFEESVTKFLNSAR